MTKYVMFQRLETELSEVRRMVKRQDLEAFAALARLEEDKAHHIVLKLSLEAEVSELKDDTKHLQEDLAKCALFACISCLHYTINLCVCLWGCS